ncbi:sugar ABC transporter permease [Paenibacillus sp. LC231]|uniref:carbohydrate ABC transporter permease n=1 Tax=unclassified Paenibacillus TaxID=185978 RepID=UPI0008DD64D2|nr:MULTISPECIES: carbohydrate ABC transporter permease [unclassified Paenibacillus]MCT1397886.1 carbohydrate ABC transporter permease [Paenibacillus sp. p3-SID867]OIA99847.1 sugar ABC transporter permease [Paenibacillus sp. LC231]
MHSRSRADRVFDLFNYAFLTLLLIVILYPLYFIIIASVSDPISVSGGKVWLFPVDFTLEGYQRIMENQTIWVGYKNTLVYMTVGTAVNVAITVTGAYPLSRKDMYGRNLFMFLITFTMFFSGGLIPTYLLVKSLGLMNSMWALILPGAVSVWNLIITRTFFQHNIPDELREAAAMDGCSDFKFFLQVALPLSKSILAVLVLFYGVSHWNSFFSALIYLRDEAQYPLQLVLRNILIQNEVQELMNLDLGASNSLSESIKYGVIIVASIPVLILYPMVQKYFVKGVMIGSLKG